jgi:hypothetical protein
MYALTLRVCAIGHEEDFWICRAWPRSDNRWGKQKACLGWWLNSCWAWLIGNFFSSAKASTAWITVSASCKQFLQHFDHDLDFISAIWCGWNPGTGRLVQLKVLKSDTLHSDKSSKWRIFAATDTLSYKSRRSWYRTNPQSDGFAWIRRMSDLLTVCQLYSWNMYQASNVGVDRVGIANIDRFTLCRSSC